MKDAGIYEEDIEEQFILGSGKGGQKVNKTNSTVLLKHPLSGLVVRCGKDRMRESNRFFARRRLLEKYLELIRGEISKKKREEAKIRKQKKRRSKKTKEKILKDKLHRSNIKQQRKSPSEEE